MEGIIAGLLRDFEDGKMTRRQLIQSLAVAAAAVVPGAAAVAQTAAQNKTPIPQAFEPAPWKTVWLDHISYAVSDYRRSTAFYRDLMGWEIRNDNGTSQCTLKIGDIGGIIPPHTGDPGRHNQPAATPHAPGDGQAERPPRPPITGATTDTSAAAQA